MKISNPYIAGGPITSEEGFYGRNDVFQFVKDEFERGTKCIVFYGGRRTGKTSIAFQIVNGKLGSRYFPIRLSFEEVALTNDIIVAFDKFVKIIHNSLEMQGVNFDIRPFELSRLEDSPFEVFEGFLKTVAETLAGRQLLLLLDEYDVIHDQVRDKNWDPQVIGFWKNLFKNFSHANFILVGSQSLFMSYQRPTRDLLDITGVYKEISFLTAEETTDLIIGPVEGIMRYDDRAIARVLRLGGGHPYFTQAICKNTFNVCTETGNEEVSIDDVEEAIGQFNENPPPHMFHLWEEIHPIEKDMKDRVDWVLNIEQKIVAITCHSLNSEDAYLPTSSIDGLARKNFSVYVKKNRIERIITRLIDIGLIEADREKGIRFRIDLIRLWIAHNYSAILPESEFFARWRTLVTSTTVVISLLLLAFTIIWIQFNPDRNYASAMKSISNQSYREAKGKLEVAISHHNWFPKGLIEVNLSDLYEELGKTNSRIGDRDEAIAKYKLAQEITSGEKSRFDRLIGDLYLKNKTRADSLKALEYYVYAYKTRKENSGEVDWRLAFTIANLILYKNRDNPTDSIFEALEYFSNAAEDSSDIAGRIIDIRRQLSEKKLLGDPEVIRISEVDSLVVINQGRRLGLTTNMRGRLYKLIDDRPYYLSNEIKLFGVENDSSKAKLDAESLEDVRIGHQFKIESY